MIVNDEIKRTSKTRFEKLVMKGTTTSKFDSPEVMMKKKFNIDIQNNPFYRVASVGSYDISNNGMYDDGPVSDYVVYKVFDIGRVFPPPPPPRITGEELQKRYKFGNWCDWKRKNKVDDDSLGDNKSDKTDTSDSNDSIGAVKDDSIEDNQTSDDVSDDSDVDNESDVTDTFDGDDTLDNDDTNVDNDDDLDSGKDDDIPDEDFTDFDDEDFDEEVELEKLKQEKIQDMLDKYYGNRKKEREYKKRMKRFKSHVVEIKENDSLYKTVERYPEYEEDTRFLQLEEFAFRLERLSRAEIGDFALYKTAAKEIIRAFNGDKKDEDYYVQYLRKQDADYISTNNYAYNQHKFTYENLKTLGKYGEQVPFLKMIERPAKEETEEKAKRIIKNVGVVVFNTFLLGRNFVLAPIDRFVGTFVVAPIHKLLYDSDQMVAGLYKNQMTHRYTARKIYFENQYKETIKAQNAKLAEEGKPLVKPKIFKLVFETRFLAVTKVKEANVDILSARGNEIMDSIETYVAARARRRDRIQELKRSIEYLEVQLEGIKQEIKVTKDSTEREELKELLHNGKERRNILKKQLYVVRKIPIPGITPTDSIFQEHHNIANKSNVTKVVSGVKMVAKTVALHFIGKNINKYVLEKISEEREIPEQIFKEEVLIPEQVVQKEIEVEVQKQVKTFILDRKALEELTFEDLLNLTKNNNITYYGNGTGNMVDKTSAVFVRGIYDHNGFLGMKVSGSDGLGFSIKGMTETQIGSISQDDKVFEVMAETITNNGTPITASELLDKAMQNPDALSVFEDLKNIQPWLSASQIQKPDGWLDVSDAFEALKDKILIPTSKISTEIERKLVTETIPAHTILKQTVIPAHIEPVVSESMKSIIDKRLATVEELLTLGIGRDLYELARRTKGTEEMVKEGTESVILSHQKDKAPEYTSRDYSNIFGFTGEKDGDYASLYNESILDEDVDVEESHGKRR